MKTQSQRACRRRKLHRRRRSRAQESLFPSTAEQRQQRLVHKTANSTVISKNSSQGFQSKGRQTGGCSSFSALPSVRSGRADIFANTPSVPTPPPITRGREPDEAVSDVAGIEVGAVGAESRAESVVDLMVGVESCRTNLALSSVSSSLASSSSKASARSLLTWPFCVGEEAREWKDGGGESGTWPRRCGTSSWSSSSWAFTCG